MLLVYIADAVWIVALAIIAGASREAGKRISPGRQVPIQVGAESGWRAPRGLALAFTPVGATVVGLAMLLAARRAESADAQLLIFGARLFMAPALAVMHLLWLGAALKTLAAEGALKP